MTFKKSKKLFNLVLIAIFFIIYFTIFRPEKKPEIDSPSPVGLSLLPDWQIVQQDQDNIVYKIEKNSADSVRPTIIVIKSQLPSDTDPGSYLNSLVKGALSTIPGLKFTVNKNISDDPFIQELEAYYYVNKTKISLFQQLLFRDETLYTLNGSYLNANLKEEIKSIFSQIVAKL